MFHWICPECGCELPPTAKGCSSCDPPACDAKAQPDPFLDLAEQIRAVQVEHAASEVPSRPPPPLAQTVALLQAAPAVALLAPPASAVPEPTAQRVPAQPSSAETPPSGSWLPLAPMQDYASVASCAMQPAASMARILTSDSGPHITLPGPALPPGLNSLQEVKIGAVGAETPIAKHSLPGWVVSVLVMLTLMVAGVGAVSHFLPMSHSNADTKPAPAAAAVVAVTPSHPVAQFIEVTGYRIVVDSSKRSEIHYLVVNHSAAELSDMTVYVTLSAASANPGQPPLCRFSFRASGLGPFASKEMISSIEKLSHSIALPDWQDLRSEIQIAQ